MKFFDSSGNATGLKIAAGYFVSATVLFVFGGDIGSGRSWLMALSAALVITAVHFRLLRPVKSIEPDVVAEDHDLGQFNQNAAGISEHTSILAIGSAEVSTFVDRLSKSIEQDQGHVAQISESCGQLSGLTDQVQHQVQETTEFTQSARNTSDQGRLSMEESAAVMSTLREEVNEASDQLKSLQGIAAEIHSIADVINGVSGQTKLLALNATIEAARAGEAGRGFAVVANGVRDLAIKTASATRNIESMLQETRDQIQGTAKIMEKVVQRTEEMTGTMETVGESFTNIAATVAESSGAMENIRGFLDGQVESVGQITDSIDLVLNSMKDTGSSSQSVSNKALSLSNSAEQIFEFLADFEVESLDRVVLDKAKQGAKQIEELFENAIETNEMVETDLFNKNYRPIPDTDPQKYHSDFDAFTDRKLPGIQEPILASHEQILYVVAQDVNCYLPTYNDHLSQPLTGDYEKDLIHNRTKKIYNDRPGKRSSKNTKPFLLQTYKRDMGDALHDLSVPLHVKGRHWGCLRVGFKAMATEANPE